MTKIQDIANYFIYKCNKDSISITNMKLQKLCYYAQGVSIALRDKRLFNNKIEAWEHGPVIRDLYVEFNKFGSCNIDMNVKMPDLYETQKEVLDKTYEAFAKFSAWKLRDMSHEETPWSKNYQLGKKNVIPNDDLKVFFKNIVESDDLTESALLLSKRVIKENEKALEILADK